MRSAIKTGVVTQFRGDYAFLSNYDVHEPFSWRRVEFVCGEQAFAYAKTLYAKDQEVGEDYRRSILRDGDNPGHAKKLGRMCPINVDTWDGMKVQIMREIQTAKYRDVVGYAGKLMNTGAMMLVEGNDWNDTFWGRCNGKGLNTLGVILMEERGKIMWRGIPANGMD